MAIRWKLREYIEEHNLSALSVEVKAGIGRNSIYRLTRADGPRLIDRETLDKVIRALRELTGSAVEVSDLLEYDEGASPS